MRRRTMLAPIAALPIALLLLFSYTGATMLSFVSDLISTSAPNAQVKHTIQFTVTRAIPASGQIVIASEGGAFAIPASFTIADMEFAVGTSGVFTDRSVAETPDAVNDGVAIDSGSDGSITITLNSTLGIASGEEVKIILGTGSIKPINPSGIGSYHVRLYTYDQSGNLLDIGSPIIAMVAPVGVSGAPTAIPPILSNGLPSGEIAANTNLIELSLEADRPSTCHYATSTGIAYASMPNSFPQTNSLLFFVTVGPGFVNGSTYHYYVRCISSVGIENSTDFEISFSLAPTPVSDSSIPPTDGSIPGQPDIFLGKGGTGDYKNGDDFLHLASVTLSGFTSPRSQVVVLRDGAIFQTVSPNSDGKFSSTIQGLERGAYTISAYAIDSSGVKSAMLSQTLTLQQGTNNTVSNVVLPPTISLARKSIAPGEDAVVLGESVPNSRIDLYIRAQGDTPDKGRVYSATTTGDGSWNLTVPSQDLERGTYLLRARSSVSEKMQSDLGTTVSLGVGTTPSADTGNRADLNKDGKINLVDFSILLSAWGTSDPDADLNQDGTVNLADFSILLFNWTG